MKIMHRIVNEDKKNGTRTKQTAAQRHRGR